jgi:hypothetical protein
MSPYESFHEGEQVCPKPEKRIEFSEYIYRDILNIVLQGQSSIHGTIDGVRREFRIPPKEQILEFLFMTCTGEERYDGCVGTHAQIHLPQVKKFPHEGDAQGDEHLIVSFPYAFPLDNDGEGCYFW